jgi:hypothetical protein
VPLPDINQIEAMATYSTKIKPFVEKQSEKPLSASQPFSNKNLDDLGIESSPEEKIRGV